MSVSYPCSQTESARTSEVRQQQQALDRRAMLDTVLEFYLLGHMNSKAYGRVDCRRMLSRKSKYGLKALLALAEEGGRTPVQAAELAERQRLPKKFLEAILLDLTRHGLIHSKKGRGGGYTLSRKPEDIAVGQVIRILNGPLALVPCVSQTAYTPCEECIDEQTCGVHLAMKEVRDATAAILDNTTLDDLGAKVRKSQARQRRRTRRI